MKDSDLVKLRPIDAFVKYFLDVKPYHTKLLEVIERYKFNETLMVDVTDSMYTNIIYKNTPLCRQVGWGLVFDDCGFSNDSCCDLFQCLGGYGIIWDNSDLIGTHTLEHVNTETDELIIDGDFTFDRRLEILNVEGGSLTLRGDHAAVFESHRLFLIAPFNVYSVVSANLNVIKVQGDVAGELKTKKEFKLNGSQGRDGLFGVSDASYDAIEGVTVVTVAGSVNFSVGVTDAYIETESHARNQGFYQVDHTVVEQGNTIVFLKAGRTFPVVTNSNNGSVQLRTALTPPRHIWLAGTSGEREYRIADSFYNVSTGKTHIVLADQLFSGETYTSAKMYGYMTNAGFDNDEECSAPKPTNIHAVIGERLVMRILEAAPVITIPEIPTTIVPFLLIVTEESIGGEG